MDIYYLAPVGKQTFSLNDVALGRNGARANIAVQLPWDEVEPTEGSFEWGIALNALNFANANGLKVSIAISAGQFTPTWVYNQGAKVFWFVNGRGQTVQAPLPWDATYLAAWEALIAAFGAQVSSYAALDHVTMAGINSKDAEISLPQLDRATWTALGYNTAIVEDTWTTITQAYAAAFPSTKLTSAHGRAFMPSFPRSGISDCTDNLIAIAQEIGPRYVLQNDGFGFRTPWQELDLAASPIGLQEGMALGSTSAISAALAEWPVAQYIEVYPRDCPLWPAS